MSKNEPKADKDSGKKVRVSTGDTQYDYVDNTVEPGEGVTPHLTRGSEATSAVLNPAFYPKDAKPEALHNEAEKRGAEFPGGGQIQAALAANADDDVDQNDPEVANPPAPAPALAGSGVSAGEQSTGAGQREEPKKKAPAKSEPEGEDSADDSK